MSAGPGIGTAPVVPAEIGSGCQALEIQDRQGGFRIGSGKTDIRLGPGVTVESLPASRDMIRRHHQSILTPDLPPTSVSRLTGPRAPIGDAVGSPTPFHASSGQHPDERTPRHPEGHDNQGSRQRIIRFVERASNAGD